MCQYVPRHTYLPWFRALSILALAVGLLLPMRADAAEEVSSLTLPMPGELSGYAPIWANEQFCPGYTRYARAFARFPSERRVIVYELGRQCARIAPAGSDIEAWVKRNHVRLDPALPHETSYLEALRPEYEAYRVAATPTECGFALGKTHYRLPDIEYYRQIGAGSAFKIYRKNDTEVEVSQIYQRYAEGWAPRSSVVLSGGLFPTEDILDDSICFRRLSPSVRYRFIVDNAFRTGPSERTDIADFFTAGQVVTADYEFPNGWLRAASRHWFSPDHAVIDHFPIYGQSTVAGLHLRAHPTTESEILYSFPDQSWLVLHAYADGWYRATPASFAPEGWVSGEFLTIVPHHSIDASVASYYLQAIVPAPRPEAQRSPATVLRLGLLYLGLPILYGYLGARTFGGGARMLAFFLFAGFVAYILLAIRFGDHKDDVTFPWATLPLFVWLPLVIGLCLLYIDLHYLFTRHPFERELRAAVKDARGIDSEKIRKAAATLYERMPHRRFELYNRRRRAEELRKLIEAERALFEELLGRERFLHILNKLGRV